MISIILFALLFIAPLSRLFIAEWMMASHADPILAGDSVWMNTFCKLDGIAMGALIALLKPEKNLKNTGWFAFFSLLLFLLGGIVSQSLSAGEFTKDYFSTLGYERIGIFAGQHVYTLTLANLMFSALILAVISGKNKLFNRILEHPVFTFSGKISFGIYVFHYPVIQLLKDYGGMDMDSWLAPLAAIPLIYLVSGLSFFLYEKRFLEMKEKFR